jgi:hypothetical protein
MPTIVDVAEERLADLGSEWTRFLSLRDPTPSGRATRVDWPSLEIPLIPPPPHLPTSIPSRRRTSKKLPRSFPDPRHLTPRANRRSGKMQH